jgi:hypothetical protein
VYQCLLVFILSSIPWDGIPVCLTVCRRMSGMIIAFSVIIKKAGESTYRRYRNR